MSLTDEHRRAAAQQLLDDLEIAESGNHLLSPEAIARGRVEVIMRALAVAYAQGREDAAKIAESPGSAAMLALAAAIRSAS